MNTQTIEVRLGSTSFVHAPGVLRWAQAMYQVGPPRNKTRALKVMQSWPAHITNAEWRQLLSGKLDYTVEGETVVFTITRKHQPTTSKPIPDASSDTFRDLLEARKQPKSIRFLPCNPEAEIYANLDEPPPPAGYTAEELDRDNPHNQWMEAMPYNTKNEI